MSISSNVLKDDSLISEKKLCVYIVAERDCSIHGHGEKWDAEGGRVVGTVELDPDTEVKIIRKGVLR